MTDEQKFFFDLKGWLLLPAVLSEAECEAVRKHLYSGGNGYTGPAQELLDQPVLVEILARSSAAGRHRRSITTSAARIRSSRSARRAGSPAVPKCRTAARGSAASTTAPTARGSTRASRRVVWELNPVEKGDGGTLFLSGTHKASFAQPPCVREPDNPHMELYSCPAGSVIIFTESLLHAATAWKNPNVDRVSIFNCYNSISSQYHRLNLPHDLDRVDAGEAPSLFRGVFVHDFTVRPHEAGGNRY